MMRIRLVTYGIIRDKVKDLPDSSLEFLEGTTIETIMGSLGITKNEVMYPLVNGDRKDLSYTPDDGDEITFLPPLSGG